MSHSNKLIKPLCCLIGICFSLSTLKSQVTNSIDTLELSRQYSANSEYKKAIHLLRKFLKNHPGDLNTLRLLAHTYYWNGDVKLAGQFFKKAINEYPDAAIVKLEYGRMLYELHEVEGAEKLLSEYLKTDPENAEALIDLGHLHFWEGDYETAKGYFQQVLDKYPGQPEASAMTTEIERLLAVVVEAGGDYETDSQPLDHFTFSGEASKYWNDWLHPSIAAGTYFFNAESEAKNAQFVEAGNRFNFKNIKTSLSLRGGIFKDQVAGNVNWTGSAALEKQLTEKISLTASASRKPELATLASLEQLVWVNDFNVHVDLPDNDSWIGRAEFGYKNHKDDNPILTASTWVMTPALKFSVFQFRLGYAFSYNDAKKTSFRSVQTLTEIIDTWEDGKQIQGIYDPYYTPENQQIHSVLAYAGLALSKKINLEVSASAGVFAKADIPYLYLDTVNNELEIKTGFSTEKAVLYDVSGKLNFKLFENADLQMEYRYFDNFFYSSHTVSLGLKLNLVR